MYSANPLPTLYWTAECEELRGRLCDRTQCFVLFEIGPDDITIKQTNRDLIPLTSCFSHIVMSWFTDFFSYKEPFCSNTHRFSSFIASFKSLSSNSEWPEDLHNQSDKKMDFVASKMWYTSKFFCLDELNWQILSIFSLNLTNSGSR